MDSLVTIVATFCIILIILFVPYFFFDRESMRLDEQTRALLPGNFVKLSDGYTHYELAGRDNGSIVVLIHGFSASSFVWDHTCPALIEAGFRVLRYDLYGRGYSDRPRVSYDDSLYDRQLLELLSALSVDSPVDLVGLSMGGAIAIIFSARHPELVKKLVLVDPAGYPVHIPLVGRIVRIPIVGDYLIQVLGNRVMVKEGRNSFHDDDKFDQFIQGFKAQMIYRGYKRAILSTLRNFNLSDQRQSYGTVGQQGRPVLLFWGRNDRIIPFENSDMIRDAIPETVFHAIDNCGHIANFEKPEIVNPILVDFLSERRS